MSTWLQLAPGKRGLPAQGLQGAMPPISVSFMCPSRVDLCNPTIWGIFLVTGCTLGTRSTQHQQQKQNPCLHGASISLRERDSTYDMTGVKSQCRFNPVLHRRAPGRTLSSRPRDGYAWLSLITDPCGLRLVLSPFSVTEFSCSHRSLNLLCRDQWVCAFPTWVLIF